MGNIFLNPPDAKPGEAFEQIASLPFAKIERITSFGQATKKGKWLIQNWGEWVLVLSGSATLNIGGKLLNMKKGDFVFIEKGCPHRVEKTSKRQKTLWLAVHFRD